jgi:hypothetical protein
MTWTYADYDEQPTTATKIARCEKFCTELRNASGAAVSKDGASRDPRTVNELLESAKRDLLYYRSLPDAQGTGSTGGTIRRVRMG